MGFTADPAQKQYEALLLMLQWGNNGNMRASLPFRVSPKRQCGASSHTAD